MVRDRDGLVAFDSGFQHATHGVMASLLVTILVAQMDFHSRDTIAESGVREQTTNPSSTVR